MNRLEDSKYFRDENESPAAELKRRILHPIKYKKEDGNKKKKNYGVILTFLFSVSNIVLKAIKNSRLAYLFSDFYTKMNEKAKNGFCCRILKKNPKRPTDVGFRASFTRLYEESLICRAIEWISARIIHSFVRIWGTGLFVFSFVTVFLAMVKYYFTGDILSDNILLGMVISFLSVPLIISKKRLGETLVSGVIPRYITLDILRLDGTKYERDDSRPGGSYGVTFAIASAVGLLTYVVNPWQLIGIVLLITAFAVIMCFPELGIVSALGFIPFSNIVENPSVIILMLIVFTVASYLFKLVRGKRVIRFEIMDVFVLMFGATVLLGGIFTSGGTQSLHSALMYLVFLSIYFLVVNSYIRKTWIYRGIKLIVITTSIVAIVGIFEDGVISSSWVDMSVFSDIGARISSFLGNPNMLGVYLIIVFPLILAQMISSKQVMGKLAYMICAVSVFTCIIMTWSRGAWLGLIVAVTVFLIIYDFRSIWLIAGGVLTLPIWVTLLPQNIINRFLSIIQMSDSSVIYRFNTWRGVFNMIKDTFFSGIGVGENAFKSSYIAYAVSGTETVMHSHNLFLEIILELGAVGLFLFIAIMFMFIQKCFKCIGSRASKSKSRTMIASGLASVTGALTMGLTDYIWYNYRVFLIFWAVIALTVALIRINEKQQAKEDAGLMNNLKNADMDIYF